LKIRIKIVGLVTCLSMILTAQITDVAAQQASTPNTQRGQSLYENHCTECHTSVVHVRGDHKAKSIPEIEQFILRWVAYRKIPWSMEEVRDVLAYINGRFYHYEEKSP